MGSAFWSYDRAEAFKASDAPLLALDTGLVIRDVNPAYLRATDRTEEALVGARMFEAFPDNPADPQADGVANLGASFRRVLCDGHRDHMPLQRYDIPVGEPPQAFAPRFWNLVNSPLRDNAGRLGGV